MDVKKLPKRKEVKTESPIEDGLLQWLKNYGLFPITQYQIGPYRADFFIEEFNLVIECDGQDFHSSDEQIKYDRQRDEYMRNLGYKVERYTGKRIYHEAFDIAKEIINKYRYRDSIAKKPLPPIIDDCGGLRNSEAFGGG